MSTLVQSWLSSLKQPSPQWESITVDLDALETYQYSPLPSEDSLRLLRWHDEEIVASQNTQGNDQNGPALSTRTQAICILEAYSRDDPVLPEYFALSYTWGPPVDSDECRQQYATQEEWVICVPDEQSTSLRPKMTYYKLQVTENLFHALERVTSGALETVGDARHIWIDAMCINQSDNQEKAKQVTAMTEIYSLSQTTVIWLGDSDPTTSAHWESFIAMHRILLQALLEHIEDVGAEAAVDRGHWAVWAPSSVYGRLGLENHVEFDWAWYARFYWERVWFKRAWVLQELVLSEDTVAMLGESYMDWGDMAMLNRWLVHTGLIHPLVSARMAHASKNFVIGGLGMNDVPGASIRDMDVLKVQCDKMRSDGGVQSWTTVCHIQNEEGAKYDFFRFVIRHLRRYGATDARDKIYAAYGIFRTCVSIPTGNESGIDVTYDKSVEDVYTDIARLLLVKIPDFLLLSEVEDASVRKLSNLPSWVPDYSAVDGRPYIGSLGRDIYDVSRFDGHRYETSQPRVEQDRLYVIAKVVDHIREAQRTPNPLSFDSIQSVDQRGARRKAIDFFIEMFHSWFSIIETVTAYDTRTMNALCRTLVADREATQKLPQISEDMLHNHLLWMCVMEVELDMQESSTVEKKPRLRSFINDITLTYPADGLPSPDTINDWVTRLKGPVTEDLIRRTDKLHTEGFAFETHMATYRANSCLFSTKSGRLGLGPKSMKPDDEVWLFKGARVFFVLRPSEDRSHYTFVGEAYLHECMNGELNSPGDIFEEIEIR